MNLIQLITFAAARLDTSKVNGVSKASASDVLAGVLNGVYFAAGAIAVIVIILAGYTFTTSVYDHAKVAQAKNAILYSVVGLVVVIVAFFITQFVMAGFK